MNAYDPYGMVWGATECDLSDGRKGFIPVIIKQEELPKFSPKECKGFFVTSPNNEYIFIPIGSKVRLESM
jgi:hypothetical protein